MKPIIFSMPMVQAIRDGRKTQTRRVIKSQPHAGVRRSVFVSSGLEDGHGREIKLPWLPGDILYVRETWAPCATIDSFLDDKNLYIYAADFDGPVSWKWRPSIHMPKDAARIFLKVKNVRAERLQEITPEDIVAEGLPSFIISPGHEHYSNVCGKNWLGYGWYRELWDSLYAMRGCPWESNPWVWVIEFMRKEAKP